MIKCVVFNGPPRSGKDSAADYITELINNQEGNLVAHRRDFKNQLINLSSSILGKTPKEFLRGYNNRTEEMVNLAPLENAPEWYKDYKGTIAQRVVNKQYSKREWLIHISENVIKPYFGKQAFGQMLVKSLPQEGLVFLADSGFKDELQPIIDHVGHENVLVLRINRKGCTFEGDSRDYLCPSMFPDSTCPLFLTIENNGTLEEFYNKVEKIVGGWL